MNATTTARSHPAEYCLRTFAAYGACILEPRHDLPHRDANGRPFYQHRPGECHPIAAVLAVINAEREPVSRDALARKTGLDRRTATDTAEAGARSGHILRERSFADGRVYYLRRVPGTLPARAWGRGEDRCPHCGKLRSVGHGPLRDAYCREAKAGRACGFIHPERGICLAGFMHVTSHMFGGPGACPRCGGPLVQGAEPWCPTKEIHGVPADGAK